MLRKHTTTSLYEPLLVCTYFAVRGGAVEELYSVEEAAERLGGVSKWSIYSWLSQGRLIKTKVGSRVMISERHLEEFISACNSETPTQQTAPGQERCQ